MKSRGLTIVELMAAMAIFIGMAGMVLQVLGGGLDLWTTGERTREASERAGMMLDRIAEELRHIAATDRGVGEPDIKLYCDSIELSSGLSEGVGVDFQSQRLLFVRRTFEESGHPVLRDAGMLEGAARRYNGDPVVAQEEVFRATEGWAEVAFLLWPDDRPGMEGRLVLWRGYQTPIGGEGSLFESLAERDGGLGQKYLEPVVENLLYFGYEFIDGVTADLTVSHEEGGPSRTWDSTRGILPGGDSVESFRWGKNLASLVDPQDDVFPRAIRLTAMLAPPPNGSRTGRLLEELPSSQTGGRVRSERSRFLGPLVAEFPYLRIGHEWVEVSAADSTGVGIVGRGRFGTRVSNHLPGEPIQWGRPFQKIVRIPMARDPIQTVTR